MHGTRVRSPRRKHAARLVASAAAWALLLVLLPRCAKFGSASEVSPDAAGATSDDAAGPTSDGAAVKADGPVAVRPRVRSTSISDTGTIARPPGTQVGDRLILMALTSETTLVGGPFEPLTSLGICPNANVDGIAFGTRIDDGTTSYTLTTSDAPVVRLLLAAIENGGEVGDHLLSNEVSQRGDDGWATKVQVGHDGDLVLVGLASLAAMSFDQDSGLEVVRPLANGSPGIQLFAWSTPLDGGAPYFSREFGPFASQTPCWGTFSVTIAPRTTTP